MLQVEIDDVSAKNITLKFLQHQLIVMKQYLSHELQKSMLDTIEHLSTLLEWEFFKTEYNRAPGDSALDE